MPDQPEFRKFDNCAKRKLREWCIAQAAYEWEKMTPMQMPEHRHTGEILRVADTYYKYIATGQIADNPRR